MSLHPTEGARYLFERNAPATNDSGGSDDSAPASESASYAVTVYTPESETRYSARLSADGNVELAAADQSLPATLETNLTAIAKTIARAARKNIDAELPPWPRRVLRWRGPGRGR